MLAEAGAVRPLVWLCAGPEGPMEDLEAKAEAEAATAAAAAADGAEAMVEVAEGDGKKKGKKGKKGKGKKGKKGKLEPGMAEAQTFCSAVLRLVSMDERWRSPLVACGAVRYLLPLLDVKLSPARWNARQLLINLSLSPSLMPTLALYKVPDYVHGGNVPGSHYDRPFTADGDDLESLPAHLAEPRAAAAAARAKPPPLKVGAGGRAPSLLQVHG
ncbi:hypothetical protein FOA52_013857 [Chlamydomonas sp. UWO 241]|nr:hypothetical protein FOA52_013857 [Chlamydomonas sp. UWO 241]